ncbi:MAG: DUF393 domain-containing protein [Deltaproteobacteria bacterium]|nr:DUF393 domain-containing protein [Deltaproteobacteria bacterium]MBT4641892.1 DUF393 domain-containing protein [Deltaproteobacteria bacterium]MBT6498928.1 DUF393 domain-containing protein [Deltaproteobacteria bacterium]MBT6613586.1 DUF393 domain-containing protein [Deltaproteobacteria bacterium]MBT7153848.1 DUF393 domain-containing protein [Deltaproteobacteria bacterium]
MCCENDIIVIFDGVCNLCKTLVIFIIKRDRGSKFKFVQAQSETGKRLQSELGIDAMIPIYFLNSSRLSSSIEIPLSNCSSVITRGINVRITFP